MRGQARVLIISPAKANANNGNWQTASRWAEFLQDDCEVHILTDWQGKPQADLMIALHARRSATAIHAWRQFKPDAPLVVVLTGTDLYRDINVDADARRSLAEANRLVVLQEAALAELGASGLPPAQVIFQSAPVLEMPATKLAGAPFATIMVGHLRAEKRPDTYMQAAQLLQRQDLRMLHVGAALEESFSRRAEQTALACPHYQWLGNLPHPDTLARLAASDLMVISSAMEGGANVIIEAVVAGVPVLASDIAGNRGMLGEDYGGYFPLGDANALARLISRAKDEPAFLEMLKYQCRLRAPLFAPAREQAQVKALVRELMDNVPRPQ